MDTKLTGIKAAMYLRKSRAEDGEDTDAVLRRHRETLTAFAAKEGISVTEIFSEVRSGENLDTRPEMLRLLSELENGTIEAVLCMDIDRLSRGATRDRGTIWEVFQETETLIVTPGKVYDLSTDADEMMLEFYGVLAHHELKKITERMQRGRQKSIEEGAYIVAAPYGYKNIHRDKTPTLEIVEDEARYVRLMYQYAADGMGGGVIAQTVSNMGARTRKGNEFNREAVNKILRNPVYIGKVTTGKKKVAKVRGKKHVHSQKRDTWQVYDGIHPPIINADLFKTVQDVLDRRSAPPVPRKPLQNPFAGILRCDVCNRAMQRITVRGTSYLLCGTKGCCPMSRMDYVDDTLKHALENVLAELESPQDNAEQRREDELASVITAIAAEELKKARLYELVEAGIYSPAEFRSRMDAAKSRLADLEAQKERLSVIPDTGRQIRDMRTALDAYTGGDVQKKNLLLKKVVRSIWYHKDKGADPATFSLRVELKD